MTNIKDIKSRILKNYKTDKPMFIYFLCDKTDDIMYIGKTQSLPKRIREHKECGYGVDIVNIYFIPVTFGKSLQIEKFLIKKHDPPMNRASRAKFKPRCLTRDKRATLLSRKCYSILE